jgi:type IV pilus assembly protein PilQ
MLISTQVVANPKLQQIQMTTLDGNRIRLHLHLSAPIAPPKSFAIDSPTRICLDFPGVINGLSRANSRPEFNVGVLKGLHVVESAGKTRVVVDLLENVPFEVSGNGTEVYLTLAGGGALPSPTSAAEPFHGQVYKTKNLATLKPARFCLTAIDFRRGTQGEGRVVIDLNDPNIPIDLKEEAQKIRIRFAGAELPANLQHKLDVTDFGTPVTTINTTHHGSDVEMVIQINGTSENIAYQADKKFTVEVRPLSKEEKSQLQSKTFKYTGEKLSLNFQDIEVRAVLQLIADFTGLNIVTSDTVNGNVTLRLRNVPWDQALDIILKTKGLGKRQMGNVLLIAPSEEIAAREKLELQSTQQVQDLAPLRAEYVQVNYAKAGDIAGLLKTEKNSLLSSRGTVSVDERTNTLLVQDTAAKLEEVRALVTRLDVPIRQVLIESRIVFATDDFQDALGVSWGGAAKFRPGNEPIVGAAGQVLGAGGTGSSTLATTPPNNPAAVTVADRLAVNLMPAAPLFDNVVNAGFGLTVARLPGGTILDVELQALESEGLGKIVASPRLVTSNQQLAYIESGEEIPYLETTSSGAASVAFKKAVLRLEVTPQITPDDHIIMDLKVNQDSRGVVTAGVPAINTREMHTKVLVANGETVVLGGIYQQDKAFQQDRIPFFGKLPVVGWMFRSETNLDKRSELMIFVTPKIIQDGMA